MPHLPFSGPIVAVLEGYSQRSACVGSTAASEHIAQIARRTVLSDDALSLLVPILEDVLGMDQAGIRSFFESHGFSIREWDKVRTDWLTIRPGELVLDSSGP